MGTIEEQELRKENERLKEELSLLRKKTELFAGTHSFN